MRELVLSVDNLPKTLQDLIFFIIMVGQDISLSSLGTELELGTSGEVELLIDNSFSCLDQIERTAFSGVAGTLESMSFMPMF